MRLNPIAFINWAFCFLVGFLVSSSVHGGLIGLGIAMGVSLVATMIWGVGS